MSLVALELFQFRNYDSLKIELPEQGALFCGKNGSGKTNILEAIALLTTGKSVRNSSLKEIIQENSNESFVKGVFSKDDSDLTLSLGFSRQKKIVISKNGKEYATLSSLYQGNKYIYFGPLDILLVSGTPEEKRQFINQIISQKHQGYLHALIEYKHLLKEVNKLLQKSIDRDLLHVYHERMAELGVYIYQMREAFFREIAPEFSELYAQMGSGDIPVEIVYTPSITCDSKEDYFYRLQGAVQKDRELGYTSLGIHRDSYIFKVGTRKMVGYGSQGQMRSSALAFKSAALSYLKKESDKKVIVAIDDAFSDLDEKRRISFFNHVQEDCQLFIALHTLEEAKLYDLPLFILESGSVTSVTGV